MQLTTLKNLSYLGVFFVTTEYLGFNPEALSVLIVLMSVDVATGVIRACAQEGCRSIKSSIGMRGVLAKILVLTGLFCVALAGKGVGFDMNGLVQGAVNIFILSELYSVLGNIHSARTGKKKNEFDAVAYMLNSVKDLLRKYVKE